MKLLTLVFFSFFLTAKCAGQKSVISVNDFCGRWKGTLEWSRPGKPVQQFTMRLNILPTDSIDNYLWQITYGDSARDVRNYVLRPVDKLKGHWIIDEDNGIMLDNYLLSNCITGAFTVVGNTITDSYCLQDGRMAVEFISMKLDDKKTTGKGTEDSPMVDSYRITGIQKGWLQKQ